MTGMPPHGTTGDPLFQMLKERVRIEVQAEFFQSLGAALGVEGFGADGVEAAVEYLKANMPSPRRRFLLTCAGVKEIETMIDNLKPRRQMYPKALGDGLYVRVYPSGEKKFAYRYQLGGKRGAPIILGTYLTMRERKALGPGLGLTVPEAQEEVRKLAIKKRDKKDPRRFVNVGGITLGRLIKKYLEEYLTSKRDAEAMTEEQKKSRRIVSHNYYRKNVNTLEKFVLPDFGGRHVVSIDACEIQELLDAVEDSNGTCTSNEVLKFLSGVRTYACEVKKMRNLNLLDDLKHKNQDPSRQRFVMTCEQIAVFFRYLDDPLCPIPEVRRRILKAMLLKGSRNQETAEGTWPEIDLKNRIWIIPARRMKGKEPGQGKKNSHGEEIGVKRPHAVFLSDFLLEILGAPEGKAIFPKHVERFEIDPDRPSDGECPQHGINTGKESLDLPFPFPDLQAYDLRHAFATHMDSLGFTPLEYGGCQSHSESSTREMAAELKKIGGNMMSRRKYTAVQVFRKFRRKAEVWIAWEAELCRILGRPIPEYPPELLDYFTELGKRGGDVKYFEEHPEMLDVITAP